MVKALERLDEVRKVGVSQLNLSWVPHRRLKLLARYAATVRAQALTRLSDERRIATLLAFVRVLEATTQDDALDLLDLLITTLLAQGEQAGQKERMRTLPELDGRL